jgi:hypothetical protein
MTSKKESQDRQDASVAQHARQQPGLFARLFAGLSGKDRDALEARVKRGEKWLDTTEHPLG